MGELSPEGPGIASDESVTKTLAILALAAAVLASPATADILVMKGPNGELHLTNRGGKAGFRVIKRYREFQGSSGMGLRSLRAGDSIRFDDTVRRIAALHRLEPALVKAVIRAESAFDPSATSPKGAMGLMQLMPDTARMHGVRNAYDAEQNIDGGVRHLRYLMDRYEGELDLVLAAYNAGTKPVDAVRGIPAYAETQEYVRRVRVFHEHYQTELAKAAPAKSKPVLARLELDARTPEELYGRPIVLIGTGAMSVAEPAPFTPVPGNQTRPSL